MSGQIEVDPNKVISAYREQLATVTHDAMVAQAAVNQLSGLQQQVADLTKQNDQLIAQLAQYQSPQQDHLGN